MNLLFLTRSYCLKPTSNRLLLLVVVMFFGLFSPSLQASYCNVGFKPAGVIAEQYLAELKRRSGNKRILKIHLNTKKYGERKFFLGPELGLKKIEYLKMSYKNKTFYTKLIKKVEQMINLDFMMIDEASLADIAVYPICYREDTEKLGFFVWGGKKFVSQILLNVCGRTRNEAQKTQVFLHEFGHALGLEHPFNDADGDCLFTNKQDGYAAVNLDYTVMAYQPPLKEENWPTWYKPIDIMALKKIWGPRP